MATKSPKFRRFELQNPKRGTLMYSIESTDETALDVFVEYIDRRMGGIRTRCYSFENGFYTEYVVFDTSRLHEFIEAYRAAKIQIISQ